MKSHREIILEEMFRMDGHLNNKTMKIQTTEKGVSYVFLDIETLPGTTKPSLDEIDAPSNYKDPDKIAAYKAENVEKEYRKQSLSSLQGRLLCITYVVDNDDPVVLYNETGDMEAAIMKQFEERMVGLKKSLLKFVAHNGLSFDFPWLSHRMWKYNLQSLKGILPTDSRDQTVHDTMKQFSGTDYKGYYKLDDIAKFFGLEGKTEGVDGSMVFDLWLAEDHDKLKKYAAQDVVVLRNVFLMMNQHLLI